MRVSTSHLLPLGTYAFCIGVIAKHERVKRKSGQAVAGEHRGG
ncbi:hypothetical protein [Sinorhizobium fredii]|nr:hypothetical protein [Sinorhizobium fredii]